MKEIKLWKISRDEQGKHLAQQLSNVSQTETENQLLLRSLNRSHFAEPVPGLAINSPWPMGTIIRSE